MMKITHLTSFFTGSENSFRQSCGSLCPSRRMSCLRPLTAACWGSDLSLAFPFPAMMACKMTDVSKFGRQLPCLLFLVSPLWILPALLEVGSEV